MKKITLILLLAIVSGAVHSQYRWDAGMRFGVSNYLGEIGGLGDAGKGGLKDLKFAETRWAVSAFGRWVIPPYSNFNLHNHLALKAAVTYLRIAGADSLSTNPGRKGRNLSFATEIVDFTIGAQYVFFEINDLGRTYRYRNNFRAYVYSGFTTFYFAPKAKYQDEWYFLRKLKTEGQTKPYSPISFAIPVGVGFYFTIEKRYRIGWELSWRKTFTDYLDDISGTYADPNSFSDPVAKALANRRGEVTSTNTTDQSQPDYVAPAANYEAGNPRGSKGMVEWLKNHQNTPERVSLYNHNKKNWPNDAYMFSTFNFSYVFRGKSSFYHSKYDPIFKSQRYKRRKVRAKF